MQFKKKSNYFHFNELLNSKDCNFFEYRGWNGLSVIKLDIFKEKMLVKVYGSAVFGIEATTIIKLSNKPIKNFSSLMA